MNTESDDDVLTILAMEESPFQSVGATVLPAQISECFCGGHNIIGYLDFWGHQEVMIKCDQVRSRAEHEENR